MNDFKWEPKEEFRGEVIDTSIFCKEPPCANCIMWQPYKKYVHHIEKLVFSHVVCCTSNYMRQDFSCFVSKQKEESID